MRELFRFSLATLILLVLFIGGGLGLWFRFEPWNCAEVILSERFSGEIQFHSLSPNRTRIVDYDDMDGVYISDFREGYTIQKLHNLEMDISYVSFVCEDLIETSDGKKLYRWHKRRPDGFLGLFYLPEFSLVIITGIALGSKIVKIFSQPSHNAKSIPYGQITDRTRESGK